MYQQVVEELTKGVNGPIGFGSPSPNSLAWVTAPWRSAALLSLRPNDVNSIGELYPQDDLRQRVMPVEAAPMFLGELDIMASAVLFEKGIQRENAVR